MAVYAEFLKFWPYHVTMTVAGCTKALVNQVEPLFARSLVECDTPRWEGTYTGSAYCGDHLAVINEGFRISAVGQSQESAGMMISLAAVAIVSDTAGRRPCVLMGVVATTMSVVVFLVGAQRRSWGLILFAVGQGFQGLFPNDFIGGLCSGDISQDARTDALMHGQVGMCIGQMVGPIMVGLSTMIAICQFENYTVMWIGLLGFNIVALILSFKYLEETKPVSEAQLELQQEHGKVKGFMIDYWVFFQKPAVWRLMLAGFVSTFEGVSVGLINMQVMAYHGWTQADMAKMGFYSVLPAIFIGPKIVQKIVDKYGAMGSYIALYFGHFVVGIAERLAVVFNPYLWFAISCFRNCFSGKEMLAGMCEMQLYETHHAPKINYLKWQVGYLAAFLANPFYYSIFDAKAVGYAARVYPNLVTIAIDVVKAACYFIMLWSFSHGTEGFGPSMAQRDAMAKELKGYSREIVAHLHVTKYRAKRIRKAGFADIFGEWVDEGTHFDDWMLAFHTEEHLWHMTKPYYEGKHLTKMRKVVDAVRELRDAEAALPLPEKKKKKKDGEGGDEGGEGGDEVQASKDKLVDKLLKLEPGELTDIFGTVLKTHPGVLRAVQSLVKEDEEGDDDAPDSPTSPKKTQQEKKAD